MFKYTTHTKTIPADMYTPVRVYIRLLDTRHQPALMDSSDYHDANNSPSSIPLNPITRVNIHHG